MREKEQTVSLIRLKLLLLDKIQEGRLDGDKYDSYKKIADNLVKQVAWLQYKPENS